MRLISHETRVLGDRLPPWWYALGREDFRMGEQHYYVLPVALLVRFGCWVRYRWDWLRSRPNKVHCASYYEGVRHGYLHGRAEGLRIAAKQVDTAVAERLGAAIRLARKKSE